ncbi:MAG TPA: hypothetical protein VFJ74_14365 [Gemmatimonadaceae bacterium]|nr:hypothetical protein [Gemmatimonadaceae bacterium]
MTPRPAPPSPSSARRLSLRLTRSNPPRSLAAAAAAAVLLAGAACSADRAVSPTGGSASGHPELRGTALVVRVDVRNGTLTVSAPAAAAVATAASSPSSASPSGIGGPRFALIGDNELGASLTNFSRSAVGAYASRKVRVRFDVALTNRLGGASLVTPTFPAPPLGQTGLMLIPFSVSNVSGAGAVAPSTDWDGDGTVGSGAPYNFFNDDNCATNKTGNDCYRWEAFASPLAPGATTAAHTVGFDVDPTVQTFQVYLVLAADLKDALTPQTGAIAGTVTSPQRGALVGVTVGETGGATATTAAGGAFQLTGLAVGSTTVTISNLPAGCAATGGQGVAVTAGGITNVSFSVTCAQARIAFTSDRTGNQEIFTMNADGTVTTQLTNNSDPDYSPSWSPDGSKIAFVSERDGNAEIYVMNADGSGQTRLTNNSAYDLNPSWSPDGTKIAFMSTRDDLQGSIYVMSANGTGVTRLTNLAGAGDWWPRWSPDGSKIAFVSFRDGNYEVYVMNANGSAPTRLTTAPGNDGAPSWSPDGKKIAFASDRAGAVYSPQDIYVMNADGSGVTQLTTDAGDDGEPVWSPDGSRIVFTSFRDGNGEVYIMNANGSNQVNITNRIQGKDWHPAW